MVEFEDGLSAEDWLLKARELIPTAISKAKEVKQFPSRWKSITAKLEQVPSRLSDLSSHPCFSKNTLCTEQLQAVSTTLRDSIALADICVSERFEGKLRMQSDLDSLAGRLDLNLRDCGLLIKTGVLGETTTSEKTTKASEPEDSSAAGVRELMARLQIGNVDAKHRALDGIVEAMREEEKSVTEVIGRSNVAALVSLLSSSPMVREKAVAVICSLAESGACEPWLVSEGAIPALIRLADSGGSVGRERAVMALQRLTASPETARAVVAHGAARPLVEVCRSGDSVSQSAAAAALRNASAAPEARRTLADEGAVGVMVELLDSAILAGAKESAAECLTNLTAANEDLRREVVRQGGARSLLAYLEGCPVPGEAAAVAVRNLVPSVGAETLEALGFYERMGHVLRSGTEGARRAAAAAVTRAVAAAGEAGRRRAGEAGIVPLLVGLLGAKTNAAREAGAQALASVVGSAGNRREVKRDGRAVPGLVQLLEPGPGNTAKKYAVFCLGAISASRRCRRLMASYGAIGYLKKLAEMEVPGAKKLLERLERGRFKSLFIRK